MRVYAGHVAGERALAQVRRHGMGILISTATWRNPVPGVPWCLDNGAFGAYRRNEPFDAARFWAALHDDEWAGPGKIERGSYGVGYPDFGVCPDIVRGGLDSLRFSLAWIERLPRQWPWLLAVQDGMRERDVDKAWALAEELEAPFGGIFVGGSLRWKHKTTDEVWARFARARDAHLHVGRVSSLKRLAWAERVRAHSVDSSVFGRAFAYRRVHAAQHQSRLL